MIDIKNQQILIFNKIKKIYKNFKKEKFHPNYDTPIYFNSSHNYSFGLIQMKKFMGKDENFFSKLFILLKDFSYSMFINNSKFENIKLDENFDKIVVTWAFKKNFKSDGSLNDRYFNYNSKNSKNIFWFVIYMDNDLPKKIGKNIFIYKMFSKKKFNFFVLVKILKKNINYFFKNVDYFLFSISNLNFLSRNIVDCFEKLLSKNIKLILIPYEGQPFQNEIIRCAKEKYGINTIGYIHAPPLAFPSNYIKKKFSPSKIFVNGLDQKAVFSKQDIFCAEILDSGKYIEYSLLSAGTDGRDGPTDAAGALVNNKSINLILEKNIDLDKEINNNNSYKVLKKINSLVIMSGTNTNVADLQLLLIK